jgi:hypothetical protein
MSRIILVHGIGQQYKGPQSLLSEWMPALQDGITLAGGSTLLPGEAIMAFYGDLFRPVGRSLGEPDLDASDITDPFDQGLLMAWWQVASEIDPAVVGPEAETRARSPYPVQRALNALGHSKYFASIAERALILDLSQVRRYFNEPRIRAEAIRRVEASITSDSRVIVGHSLGSVVAYEALCAHPEWPVENFVTLGSPLGLRGIIFERLNPAPVGDRGVWPPSIRIWRNISDRGDIVATEKRLGRLFGGSMIDVPVHNGSHAHDVRPYLTARETGVAISD